MRGVLSRFGAGLVALAATAATAGCGHDPFSAPSRPRPSPSAGADQGSKMTYVVYVMPGPPTGDLELWGITAQREANIRQAIFRIMGPTPDHPEVKQAGIVRKALEDKASALVVVPGDDPELGKALADAEAQGVPVVLIGRSVPWPEGGPRTFTVVDHGEFDESARKLVAATREDAGKAGRAVDGTALILADRETDTSSGRRVAALKAAAESSGFARVVVVPFEPNRADSPKQAVLEAVKANPDVAVVLGDDSNTMAGASEARMELKGNPAFFVGGYTDYGTTAGHPLMMRESAYYEGLYGELGGLAVKTALAKVRGEAVGSRVVLTSKFNRGMGAVATEDDQQKMIRMRGGARKGEAARP